MGVYIKGMTAQQARMWLNYHMPFTFVVTNDDITEVPEPHGDLIDADEFAKTIVINGDVDFINKVAGLLMNAPTVIKAEGEQ